VCGISGALALFFAIGLNLAGLACLLPISPSTYNLLILPIVILTDALTAAILGAVYYMVRSRATALVHFLIELCSLGILGLSSGRSCERISIEETSTVISSSFRQIFSLSCHVCCSHSLQSLISNRSWVVGVSFSADDGRNLLHRQ
jgi:hypothetical protein